MADVWWQFREAITTLPELNIGAFVQSGCRQRMSDEVRAGYDAPFPVPESRVGVFRFPELVATSSSHPSAAAMLDVRERLRRFEQPALVCFGDSDPIFPRRAAEAMAELLPNAELAPPVDGAGHFLQEDRGEVVAERIAAFL